MPRRRYRPRRGPRPQRKRTGAAAAVAGAAAAAARPTGPVELPNPVVVKDLAEKLVVSHAEIINVLIRNGIFATVNQSIDFDTASPGPRVWVLADAAYRFVPLTDPGNPDAPHPGRDRQARRLARFCERYGSPRIRPGDVVDAAIARLAELVAFIVDAAATGDPAQQRVLDRGDTVIYERDIAYLRQHREMLARWV